MCRICIKVGEWITKYHYEFYINYMRSGGPSRVRRFISYVLRRVMEIYATKGLGMEEAEVYQLTRQCYHIISIA
jgi:hypothetical protein